MVAEHAAPGTRWCEGEGQKTLSRAKAWGWPVWEQMSAYDKRVALVHVMECSSPVTAGIRKDHPGVPYRDVRFAKLAHHQACVHAWDQTGGWEVALQRWGVDQVRSQLTKVLPMEAGPVLSRYGWGPGCEPFVEQGRVVGALPGRGAVRPQGWLWRSTVPGPPVAVPDRRSALGRMIMRHLMVVQADPSTRVESGASDRQLGGAVRRSMELRVPLEVQDSAGEWARLIPTWDRVGT